MIIKKTTRDKGFQAVARSENRVILHRIANRANQQTICMRLQPLCPKGFSDSQQKCDPMQMSEKPSTSLSRYRPRP